MITDKEKIELLELIETRYYQRYHPAVYNILKRMQEFNFPGVFHANTFDAERSEFIFNTLDLKGLKVLDIGANIGYFTFGAIFAGADKITSIESDEKNFRLIEFQSKLLGVNDKINVINKTFDFSNKLKNNFDLVLCLNVLHHVGRYFGDKNLTIEQAKEKIIEYLNLLAHSSKYCWFQIGFNWKGEEDKPLFAEGLKQEVTDFIKRNSNEYWEILKIGILEPISMKYQSENINMQRNDDLGEFGNRPLFLLKSKLN